MYYAYILECNDHTLYSGVTNDLDRRIQEHNDGVRGARYTRSRRPVHLRYTEAFMTKGEALSREAGLKKLSRSEKLALIAGTSGSI